MEDKKTFSIPTKEQMRNRINLDILESKNEELYILYDEAVEGLWNFGHIPELANDFKTDKELIKLELKIRGLKVPSWIYDFGLMFRIKRGDENR